ncbi:MAG: hypothetical protein HFJ12_00160 [Bacilli bacterium]|nr:hypothetical protein [Bacilli bacterium]
MGLRIQIISLFFSFVFGIIFSVCTNINYKFLFCKKKLFQIIITIIYVVDASLAYFLIIRKINEGVIHSYFLISVAIGFFIGFVNLGKYINLFKNKIKNCLKNVKKKKV